MQGEMLQGTLDLLILRTLAVGPAHGHTIAYSIERQSDEVLQVEHGSLYPAPTLAQDLEQNEELTLLVPPFTEPNGSFFNCREAPLNDARVRRALALAIDRERLVGVINLDGAMPFYDLIDVIGYGASSSTLGDALGRAASRTPLFPHGHGLAASTS